VGLDDPRIDEIQGAEVLDGVGPVFIPGTVYVTMTTAFLLTCRTDGVVSYRDRAGLCMARRDRGHG
jgi:hypothetical protein